MAMQMNEFRHGACVRLSFWGTLFRDDEFISFYHKTRRGTNAKSPAEGAGERFRNRSCACEGFAMGRLETVEKMGEKTLQSDDVIAAPGPGARKRGPGLRLQGAGATGCM